MLMSKEATKFGEDFIQSLKNDELKLEIEPQLCNEINITEEYLQKRLDSYKIFLESDICKNLLKESEKPL